MKRLALLTTVFASGLAWGQPVGLGDPTRPPAAFAGPAPVDAADQGLRLQSVLLPKGGKPTAIINGQLVPLGGKVGEARLVRLSETEAVLQGPQGSERLALTPDAKKTMAVPKAAAKDTARTSAGSGDKRERP